MKKYISKSVEPHQDLETILNNLSEQGYEIHTIHNCSWDFFRIVACREE